jgi:arylsulfatase A-like enzyme
MDECQTIVVLSLDALRPDHLGVYGHGRETSPRIDEVATEAWQFERAVSPDVMTLNAVTSMLTGEPSGSHQSGTRGRMAAETPLVTERLSRAGYTTGLVTCNPFLTTEFGFDADVTFTTTKPFDRGLDVRQFFNERKDDPKWRRYAAFFRQALGPELPYSVANALQFKFGIRDDEDDGAGRATDRAEQFLRDADGSAFLYIHYTETHMNSTGSLPYSAPDEDLFRFVDEPETLPELANRGGEVSYDDTQRGAHRRLYDGAVRYLDRHVGRIVDTLRETGRWDDTLLVVTGDHGEMLGERGLLGHGYLYEPGVRVPLVVRPPGGDRRELTERVNIRGIARTALSAAGVDADPGGSDLLDPATFGHQPVIVQNYRPRWKWSRYATEADAGRHAVYDGDWKLLALGDRRELYNLEDDPAERENLIDAAPDRRTALAELLDDRLVEMGSPAAETDADSVEFEAATQDRLQDLGYLE